MNNYELMVIFTPVLSNEEFKAATKHLKNFITDNQGEIVGEDAWGLKTLAYPIDKKTTGLYYVLEYKADPAFNAKFRIQMNRDESIMRHMFTTLDKHAVTYNARKRNGEPTVKAQAPATESLNENTEA